MIIEEKRTYQSRSTLISKIHITHLKKYNIDKIISKKQPYSLIISIHLNKEKHQYSTTYIDSQFNFNLDRLNKKIQTYKNRKKLK